MLAALIICVAVGALITFLSIILLTGRGAFLVAGYNTMPKEKKALYDAPAMSKFAGKIALPIGILTVLAGFFLAALWFWIIYAAIVLALVVFALVYSNTGNRFKK